MFVCFSFGGDEDEIHVNIFLYNLVIQQMERTWEYLIISAQSVDHQNVGDQSEVSSGMQIPLVEGNNSIYVFLCFSFGCDEGDINDDVFFFNI